MPAAPGGDHSKSLIVQSDGAVLLDVHSEGAEEARAAIAPFAELEKSPEHLHSYRVSPLSLWNAASAGYSIDAVLGALAAHSRYELPRSLADRLRETYSRWGRVELRPDGEGLLLACGDAAVAAEIGASRRLAKYLTPAGEEGRFRLGAYDRGTIKVELMAMGWPVDDKVPLSPGEPLDFDLADADSSGRPFALRDYQAMAARAFSGDGRPGTGFGAIVLPCGSGKTVVGMACMAAARASTLILTTNIAAVHQWMDELADKSRLPRDMVGEYTGKLKEIRPVTIATYQVLTWRPSKDADYPHLSLFRARDWGFVIYDEVHLLPAPVFRATAEIQATRRLGLTATLVREDGKESEVFALVGPKRYDVPWKELEARGFIATASCREIRVDLSEPAMIAYAVAETRAKHRVASENPRKLPIVRQLVENHPEDLILVIGQYIDQLQAIAKELGAPIITGSTPNPERERLYAEFRKGALRVLVVSKVANFAIDLPDASVAVQVSGTFGSRQEEAQRLGRILRPKKRNSYFYTIVSSGTVEELCAANRQKFLAEQGYRYTLERWEGEEL